MAKKAKTFEERVKETMDAEIALYEKAKIGKRVIVVFPQEKPPLLGRFGLWLVRAYGGLLDTHFYELK